MDRDALRLPAASWPSRLFGIVTAIWVTVTLCLAILGDISNLPILEHTARNLYFHVPLWFVLYAFALVGAWQSLRYLVTGRQLADVKAEQAWLVSTGAGIVALLTGVVWSRFTWYTGTTIWWNGDPRQTMVAVQLLIGGAYFLLRGSLDDPRQRGRLSAVYALFATATMPFLTYVLPRTQESLHPGAEGNPAFSQMDIAPEMRWVFYASAIGFLLLGTWVYRLRVRSRVAELRTDALLHASPAPTAVVS